MLINTLEGELINLDHVVHVCKDKGSRLNNAKVRMIDGTEYSVLQSVAHLHYMTIPLIIANPGFWELESMYNSTDKTDWRYSRNPVIAWQRWSDAEEGWPTAHTIGNNIKLRTNDDEGVYEHYSRAIEFPDGHICEYAGDEWDHPQAWLAAMRKRRAHNHPK